MAESPDADPTSTPVTAPRSDGEDDAGEAEINEHDALAALDGQEQLDLSRTLTVLAERLRRIGSAGIRAQTVNLFLADVDVGGDFVTGGERGGPPRARLRTWGPVAALESVIFVRPDGFDEALRLLRDLHVLVLAAPPGSGRATAAARLLTEVADDDTHDVVIKRVRADDLETSERLTDTNSLYLFRGALHDDLRARVLRSDWGEETSARLTANASFLVVIVDAVPGERRPRRRAGHVDDGIGQPDPFQVLRAHLRAEGLDPDDPRTAPVTESLELREHLAEWSHPRHVSHIAGLIAAAVHAGDDIGAALADAVDPDLLVGEWFADQRYAPEPVSFGLALAVLEDSTYLTVADAAADLLGRLYPRSDTTIPVRFRDTAALLPSWIDVQPTRPSAGNRAAIVGFRSAGIQNAVLNHLWEEIDGARPDFLEWWEGLVDHPDAGVRTRAATAAGAIALGDFDHALTSFLVRWASAAPLRRRYGAALALNVVGADDELAERVWTLLHEWAGAAGRGRTRLAGTAALALGGPLGVAQPTRALAALRRMLDDGPWSLLDAVALSIVQLARGGRTSETIDALHAWSDDDSTIVTRRALACFLTLVSEPIGEDGTAADRDTTLAGPMDSVPAWVPFLLSTTRPHRGALAELWARALTDAPLRPHALRIMRSWLRVVDEVDVGYSQILDLLVRISDRSDRDAERIEYHLERWADDDNPSGTAARLLDALQAAE